jgi:hypothetical protein
MRETMGKAVSATKVMYGFKLHILYGEDRETAINFCFSKGSVPDVCFLGKLTENCTGSEIGDSEYVDEARAKCPQRRGFCFPARAGKDMKIQNTPDGKRRPKKRHCIENFIHRLKEWCGEDFSPSLGNGKSGRGGRNCGS